MPLYEFACGTCDSRFERLMSFDAARDGAVECPTCGGHESRRLISTFAALSRSADGSTQTVAGGGCACSAGGCGCGCAH
ncbi:MAG TPA: zinc ribbon domain-containing protein [Chloroflexota bacterium]|jgi:putative FmdB family regulatory protein|nr:zinc ribbon domain-containing protein [Chloroflexota bacterium]